MLAIVACTSVCASLYASADSAWDDLGGGSRVVGQRYSRCGPSIEGGVDSKLNRIKDDQASGDVCLGFAMCDESTFTQDSAKAQPSPPSRTIVACRAPANASCGHFTKCANTEDEFGISYPRIDESNNDGAPAKPQKPLDENGNAIQ